MNLKKIEKIKGFMPANEGKTLLKWAEKFSNFGPILEIGTYCGKSSLYLALGAQKTDQYVFTIDHHLGSEEHQLNEEYFDNEIYDFSKKRVNTFPLLIKNINKLNVKNIVPIVSESKNSSFNWKTNLGMLFIDGGHSFESANNDYECWESKLAEGGCLAIHYIFEDPNDGGQAPFQIFQKALRNNYKVYEQVDTLICLIKG